MPCLPFQPWQLFSQNSNLIVDSFDRIYIQVKFLKAKYVTNEITLKFNY